MQQLAATRKRIAASPKSRAAAIASGGAAAAAVVILVCIIALVVGSPFGVFFSAQPTGSGTALKDVVRRLSGEYAAGITQIAQNTPHDRQEYSAASQTAIRWEDVLSVFAADMAAADYGKPVAVLETAQIDRLREILWKMHPLSSRTYTVQRQEEQTLDDGAGHTSATTVIVTETVLEFTVGYRTPQDTAAALGFTRRQKEHLTLLSSPRYNTLWGELLGGYVNGGGQIITPDGTPAGIPIGAVTLQWPLPGAFAITSGFGERTDPFTGKKSYHGGTDIAAPEGTPILAAADGTVTIANATDPWGGSYGFHVKLDHGSGVETLYAHCCAICVTPGQTVQQGEVIAYVGSTGNSTGNHLHFEVWVNGQRTDATACFTT